MGLEERTARTTAKVLYLDLLVDLAVVSGSIEMLELALSEAEEGQKKCWANSLGSSAIDKIINNNPKNAEAMVRRLIEAGADIEAPDRSNMTLLMEAVHKRRAGVVSILLNAGADTERKDNSGFDALMWASTASMRHGEPDRAIVTMIEAAKIERGVNEKMMSRRRDNSSSDLGL